MQVKSARDLGLLIRSSRRKQRMTQAQLAATVGASRKWVIDLEAGKQTSDLRLVLRTLNAVGLDLDVRERATRRDVGGVDIDAIINEARRPSR